MGVLETKNHLQKQLASVGIDAVGLERPGIDQIGDYLLYHQMTLSGRRPPIHQFAFFIARSDLEGHLGAYETIDKVASIREFGTTVEALSLLSAEGGLFIYRALINCIERTK